MIGNKQHYILAGATGLIGSSLLDMLLNNDEVGKVTVFTRRPLERSHAKLSEKQVDFETLSEKDFPKNVDATFCCLGTTMKTAGSRDAFVKVDYEYVVKLAVFSQRSGVAQFHVVSAKGANIDSKIFYNKVKGRMENELQKLGKIRSIYVYQPSMLLGNRAEFRFGETVGKIAMKAFSFVIPKSYKAIHDAQVAYAMLHHALNPTKGVHKVDNAEMHRLAP